MLTFNSGARTKRQLNPVLTALSRDTAPRVVRHLDIRERPQLISHNTVVCLSSRVLSQRDRWLTSSRQPHMVDNQGAMGFHHSNRRLDMEASRWVTEALPLPVPVVMAVVSPILTLSGVSPPRKLLGTASRATRARYHLVYRTWSLPQCTLLLLRKHGMESR